MRKPNTISNIERDTSSLGKKNRMKLRLVVITMCLATFVTPVLASEKGPVWFWFSACGGPKIKLEVRIDNNNVYQSFFPICRAERSSVYSKGQEKKINFVFKAPRAIVWHGYRDEDNTTNPGQKLEGDVWLAGADPNALILVISFMTHDAIYMNTVHIAYPDRRNISEIAPGLVVITMPMGLSGKKK